MEETSCTFMLGCFAGVGKFHLNIKTYGEFFKKNEKTNHVFIRKMLVNFYFGDLF